MSSPPGPRTADGPSGGSSRSASRGGVDGTKSGAEPERAAAGGLPGPGAEPDSPGPPGPRSPRTCEPASLVTGRLGPADPPSASSLTPEAGGPPSRPESRPPPSVCRSAPDRETPAESPAAPPEPVVPEGTAPMPATGAAASPATLEPTAPDGTPPTSRRRSSRSRRAAYPRSPAAPGRSTRAAINSSCNRGAVAPVISVNPALTTSAARDSAPGRMPPPAPASARSGRPAGRAGRRRPRPGSPTAR
jgi:hypothetical protein